MIVRNAVPADAEAMSEILNAIIAIGGTTAHQHPKTAATIVQHYIDGTDVLTSVVAEIDGAVVGWQSVGWWEGDAHIGSFVQPGLQARGTGAAMFAAPCAGLRQQGQPSVYASIRADNAPGLAFYGRAGFVEVSREPGFALEDGRVVGRVLWRFDI